MFDTIWVPSPNFTPGRLGDIPQGVIVHHSECDARTCDDIFRNPDPNQPRGRRSTHYLVCRDGSIHHYVHESDTAWGSGNWTANLKWINIEFEEEGDNFTDIQYEHGYDLIKEIGIRWGFEVDANTVVPHRHFSATTCPGMLNILRLFRSSLSSVDSPGSIVIPTQGIAAMSTAIPIHTFPKIVNVLVPLKVRTDPSLSARVIAQPTPNGVLNPPYSFEAQDAVRGEEYTIKGITGTLWLKTPLGHFVASGGTDYQPQQLNA